MDKNGKLQKVMSQTVSLTFIKALFVNRFYRKPDRKTTLLVQYQDDVISKGAVHTSVLLVIFKQLLQ